MKKYVTAQTGFTLLELLIVIVCIIILIGAISLLHT